MANLLKTCRKDILCFDCDDEECMLSGKAMHDCPKYECDNDILYDCNNCDFIKEHQRKFRERQKGEG